MIAAARVDMNTCLENVFLQNGFPAFNCWSKCVSQENDLRGTSLTTKMSSFQKNSWFDDSGYISGILYWYSGILPIITI